MNRNPFIIFKCNEADVPGKGHDKAHIRNDGGQHRNERQESNRQAVEQPIRFVLDLQESHDAVNHACKVERIGEYKT